MESRYSCSLLLVMSLLLLFLDSNEGTPGDLSFKAFKKTPSSPTTNFTHFDRGNDVTLNCSSQSDTTSALVIKRQDGSSAETVAKGNNRIAIMEFKSISCDKMGVYVCEGDNNDRITLEMGIYNCPPLLCQGESQNKTIYIEPKKNISVTLCVMAYPDISSSAQIDGNTIRKNKKDDDVNWSWGSEKKTFNMHTIFLNITNFTKEMYGTHKFSISTSQQGQHSVEFALLLTRPGKPACPDNLQGNASVDSILLSWKPGAANGPNQKFQVFFNDSEYLTNWIKSGNLTEDFDNVNVTGLKANTTYRFRIEVHNGYTTIDCDAYSTIRTEASPNPSTKATSSPSGLTVAIIVAVIVVIVLIVVVTIAAVLIYKKLKRIYSRVRVPQDASTTVSPNNPRARYIHRNRNSSARTIERNLLDGISCGTSSTMNNAARMPPKDDLLYLSLIHDATGPKKIEPNQQRRPPNQEGAEPDLEAARPFLERREPNLEAAVPNLEKAEPIFEKPRPKPRVKIQNDKVEYVTLDHEKSGKFPIEDLSEYQGVIEKYEMIYSNLEAGKSKTGKNVNRLISS